MTSLLKILHWLPISIRVKAYHSIIISKAQCHPPQGYLSDPSAFTPALHPLCSGCSALLILPWTGKHTLLQGLGTCLKTSIWYVSSSYIHMAHSSHFLFASVQTSHFIAHAIQKNNTHPQTPYLEIPYSLILFPPNICYDPTYHILVFICISPSLPLPPSRLQLDCRFHKSSCLVCLLKTLSPELRTVPGS